MSSTSAPLSAGTGTSPAKHDDRSARPGRRKHFTFSRRFVQDGTSPPVTQSVTPSGISGISAPLNDLDSETAKRSGRLTSRALLHFSGRMRVKKDTFGSKSSSKEPYFDSTTYSDVGPRRTSRNHTYIPDSIHRAQETIEPTAGAREVRRKGSVRVKEGRSIVGHRPRNVEIKGSTMFWRKSAGGPAVEIIHLRACIFFVGKRPTDITIQTSRKSFVLRLENATERDSWFVTLERAAFDRVHDYYSMGKRIGVGTFGAVYEAVCIDTCRLVAIKTVDRVNVRHPKELEFIRREIDIIRQLDHPQVVKAHEIFDGGDKVHFVMELLAGGDLFDAIAHERNFSEQKAAIIIRDVLTAVEYLHSNDIVHRDIKPENILCAQKEWPIDIKLADFGTARFSNEVTSSTHQDQAMSTIVGTAFYLAPEVFHGGQYSFPVDLWSCGVILYAIISGRLPWPAQSEQKYCAYARHGLDEFSEGEWLNVSEECKDLVQGLLQVDPTRRLTANQALRHPWLAPQAASMRRMGTDRSLLTSASRREWKQTESFLRRNEKRNRLVDENVGTRGRQRGANDLAEPENSRASTEAQRTWAAGGGSKASPWGHTTNAKMGALDRQFWRQAWSEVDIQNGEQPRRRASAVIARGTMGVAEETSTTELSKDMGAVTKETDGARVSPTTITHFPSIATKADTVFSDGTEGQEVRHGFEITPAFQLDMQANVVSGDTHNTGAGEIVRPVDESNDHKKQIDVQETTDDKTSNSMHKARAGQSSIVTGELAEKVEKLNDCESIDKVQNTFGVGRHEIVEGEQEVPSTKQESLNCVQKAPANVVDGVSDERGEKVDGRELIEKTQVTCGDEKQTTGGGEEVSDEERGGLEDFRGLPLTMSFFPSAPTELPPAVPFFGEL